jgi:hypothetical protein
MDMITRALLEEFIELNELTTLPEDEAFEHFAGSLMISSHYSESFSSDDIVVGAGGDCGIDAIGIIVNGSLVTEPEEIDDLADTNGYLDVSFIFVQAKRTSSFESSKIGHFGFGVLDFFLEAPQLPQNDRIQLYHRISQQIFKKGKLFTKGNPQCALYYVTTGRWTEDQNLSVRRDAVRKDIEELGLFRRVVYECVDAGKLQKLYRESQNAITREITFTQRTVIPEIPGVDQAYIGLLPGPEFLKIIENENLEIVSSLFYDNVRHWQEWNAVNTEMRQTLENAQNSLFFPLLNNGITIVARKVSPTGNKFVLEDYQVVNGCQSSYVMHECREHLTAQVMVPVRIIATTDEDIKNSIIKATNRQTQVTEDQLFALSEFPKKLEAYFPAFSGSHKLYYERRSRQYSNDSTVEKIRIVNMTTLVRSYASIFLSLPHRTTRNYKALLKTVGTDIFGKEHKLEPYYVSAFAHYRLESLFRKQILPGDLKAARYHLLLAYRLLAMTTAPPKSQSNEMIKYCETLRSTLWDDELSNHLREVLYRRSRPYSG